MNISVIVATHKDYHMPDDDIYVPLHVGACRMNDADLQNLQIEKITGTKSSNKWDEKYEKDNTGENISDLNPSFCELTGLYWAWKNIDAEYIGMVQYRRHFRLKKKNGGFADIISGDELEAFIPEKKIFVPKKRKYYIETLYSHYAHTHYAVQLDAAREIISKLYPDYTGIYDKVIKQRSGYMFNMFIMNKELFDDYCKWLFDILFALKDELGAKKISDTTAMDSDSTDTEKDMPHLSDFQARFYGRISEIIFNVWLFHHIENNIIRPDEIKELGYLNLEGENWGRKIFSFLKAKFFGQKYEKSF